MRAAKRQPCCPPNIDCGFHRSAILVNVCVRECARYCFKRSFNEVFNEEFNEEFNDEFNEDLTRANKVFNESQSAFNEWL